MKFNRRVCFAALGSVALIGVVLLVWNWHYRRYVWPQEIQANVLGSQIAGSDRLVSSDGFSAYGEGVFRWTYDTSITDAIALAAYCDGESLVICHFTRTKRLESGVVQSVTYENGRLTVEEVWE